MSAIKSVNTTNAPRYRLAVDRDAVPGHQVSMHRELAHRLTHPRLDQGIVEARQQALAGSGGLRRGGLGGSLGFGQWAGIAQGGSRHGILLVSGPSGAVESAPTCCNAT